MHVTLQRTDSIALHLFAPSCPRVSYAPANNGEYHCPASLVQSVRHGRIPVYDPVLSSRMTFTATAYSVEGKGVVSGESKPWLRCFMRVEHQQGCLGGLRE